MKNTFLKKAIFMMVVCCFVLTFFSLSYATDDIVNIKFQIGKNIAFVNDDEIQITPPFVGNKDAYIPLRVIGEAFGAEINWKDQGEINIVYNSVNIDIDIGETEYIVNQKERTLKEFPQLINGVAMVPLELIKENFDVTAAFYRSSGKINIILNSDGALKDLSFLTNSVIKKTVGNSYFNWSIDVPKGSRTIASSFNSKSIRLINEQRKIIIEVNIESDNKINIEEVYESMNEDSEKYVGSKLIDSLISEKKDHQYAEFLYNSIDNQAVLHRVYVSPKYLYNVILVSLEESDPYILKNNVYYKNLMNSFTLDYKGDSQMVQDLSKVNYGFAKYYNYSTLLSGNKYFLWEMDVLPEWDSLNSSVFNNILKTKIGLDNEEYFVVEVDKIDDLVTIEEYGEKEKLFNSQNLSTKNYEFISNNIMEILGNKVYKLVYSIKLGDKIYRCEDNYVLVGNLVYNISIKCTKKTYEIQKENYDKMLASFKPANNEISKLEKDIASYKYEQNLSMLGKFGKNIEYKNKDYGWKAKFPGNWIKDGGDNKDSEFFLDSKLGMSVFIQAVENNSITKVMDDIEKFSIMKDVLDDKSIYRTKMKQTSIETLSEKGSVVRVCTYRIEDEEKEDFGTAKFYTINKDKYSYCFFTIIPDLVSTDKNLKVLNDIWNSFTME